MSLTFDSTGARVFARITEKNVNKRLAIILDGNVHSAPVIREKIAGGSAQISGGFTNEEAADLAIVLRAGALPAPVTIVQNVTVGPSLGRDSIEAGIKAGIVGAALVLVFMLVYYKTSGLIADVAVFLNIVMLLGVMAYFSSTLTLPGIAGIVLTIGMGVDSNVLIFERIKEELLAGRTAHSAIQAGYDRAWWTVVDSHVTTLITAAVLFQFGSGPIKGFAVTLSMGIFINLFTALVGTKLVFDIRSEKFGIKKSAFDRRHMNILGKTSFDFMGKRKIALVVSAILAIAGFMAILAVPLGKANLGTDFAGGLVVNYRFEKPVRIEDARKALEDGGYKDADLQEFAEPNKLLVRVKRGGGREGRREGHRGHIQGLHAGKSLYD